MTYTGPPTNGNGLFTFFDDGSQYPFGALRIYQLLVLSSGSGSSLVLPGLSSSLANVSQILTITNKATDSNPSATQAYNVTTFPAVTPAPAINNGTGIITLDALRPPVPEAHINLRRSRPTTVCRN